LKLSLHILIAAITATAQVHGQTMLPQPARTSQDSQSKQFVIFHPEAEVRSAMARFAEKTKADLLQTFRIRDAWEAPIVIRLVDISSDKQAASSGDLSVLDTQEGLSIQLHMPWNSDRLVMNYRREILRALSLELAYRGTNQLAEGHVAQVPSWFTDGLNGVLDIQNGDLPASLFQSLLAGSDPLNLELLEKTRAHLLPATAQMVHRAKAAALVRALLDFEDGRARLLEFLTSFRDPGTAGLALEQRIAEFFPEMVSDRAGIQKWWSIALARLGSAARIDQMTLNATASAIEDVLAPAPGIGDLVEPVNILELVGEPAKPEHREAMQRIALELTRISTNANPLFQPVIAEYHSLLALALDSSTKPEVLAAKVREAEALREGLGELGSEIEDYINWTQATQIGTASGEFDEYFRAADKILQSPRPKRDDPVTLYIDSLESELNRPL